MATFALKLNLFCLFCHFRRAFYVLGVEILDALARATFKALTAANALAVINDRNVVDQMDCAGRTTTLALAASNATCLALGHNVLAATLRRAGNIYLG